MFAARAPPYVACFTNAETFFEVTTIYFRRAGGMTVEAQRAGVTPALRCRK
jgi:hypothetical protein